MNARFNLRRWHALVLMLLGLPALALAQVPPTANAASSTAAILFSRTQWIGINIDRISIYLTDPQGLRTVRLTPSISGFQFKLGGWSPRGTSIVYELVRSDRPAGQSQLYVMDRQGGGVHRITSGVETHSMPVWGPGGIAYAEGDCLALVRGNGENQHKVFCAPEEPLLRAPQWLADGQNVLIMTGRYIGHLDPPLHESIWRVNTSTGQATLLFERLFGGSYPGELTFSPTGREGLFWGSDLASARVDLTTATLSPYPISGGWFRYSADGRRTAFGGSVVLPGGTSYANLYVAGRLGGHLVQLTRNYSNPDIDWVPAQWSRDGRYVLAMKRTLDEMRWLHPARQELRIVDVATGNQIHLPDGEAAEGAWFEP